MFETTAKPPNAESALFAKFGARDAFDFPVPQDSTASNVLNSYSLRRRDLNPVCIARTQHDRTPPIQRTT
jgi:hypothetical protein